MEITRTASYKVWESPERALLFARWSYEPAPRAIVFVHGLASSWDTWKPFRAVLETAAMSGSDVFFFDYESLGTTIPRAGHRLREVLDALMDPSSALFRHASMPGERANDSPYARIDIASHSLGAVVSRIALTELANDYGGRKDLDAAPTWQIDQLLLAPAQLGSKLPYLMKYLGTEALFSALQFVRNGGISAIMDLKEGSDLLRRLEALVQKQLDDFPVAAHACGLHVSRTAHGQHDHVVIQGLYAGDDTYTLRDADHFSIVPDAVSIDEDFILGRP